MNVTFRQLTLDECVRMKEMDASQYVGRAWRDVDGKRELVEIHYQDPDWPNGYEHHFRRLQETIIQRGSAIGVRRGPKGFSIGVFVKPAARIESPYDAFTS